MLATSPSPNFPSKHLDASYAFSPSQNVQSPKHARSALNHPQSDTSQSTYRSFSTRSLDRYTQPIPIPPRPTMVDASTQYSPPQPLQPTPAPATTAATPSSQTPTSTIAGLQLSEIDHDD